MTISNLNYRPICTQYLIQKGSDIRTTPTKNWKQTALKVVQFVGIIFIFPLALLADGILFIGSLAKHCFILITKPPIQKINKLKLPTQPTKKPTPAPTPPKITPARPTRNPPTNDIDFFKDAIEHAYRLLDSKVIPIYEELIENEGVLLSDGEPPVEIYQWTANCLILHACRNPQNWQKFFGENLNVIKTLQTPYSKLPEEDRDVASYMLLVQRDADFPEVKKFVEDCDKIAMDLPQNPQFTSLFGKMANE